MKRQTFAEVRRQALKDARAEVRADILLDRPADRTILERVTRSLDRMIEKTS